MRFFLPLYTFNFEVRKKVYFEFLEREMNLRSVDDFKPLSAFMKIILFDRRNNDSINTNKLMSFKH